MAKDPTKKPPLETTNKSHPNPEEEIRRSAYELYEQRGREDGRALDDWLRAEVEVNNRAVKAA
jgi:oligoendopeptidase F